MTTTNNYTADFLNESIDIINNLDHEVIESMVRIIAEIKTREGRLFFCGSGGGAGHASHATCDFRKLAGIESYSVTDNVSELTARVNDESWADSYANWLKVSKLNSDDAVFIFSVGGGDEEKQISENLVRVVKLANEVGANVLGVAGRDGGYLAKHGDAVVLVPPMNPANITTQTEGFQALVWHLVVCHPALNSATPKWESSV
jgi:D-sedoheptulose 7-phosphate isomerase